MRRLEDEVELAALNHRLVTQSQLRHLGLSAGQIRLRVAKGLLHPVIKGVYCLDPPVQDFMTRAIALCLRCPEGFLSGTASARYWGMRRGIPNLFEFTVPPRGQPIGTDFALLRFSDRLDEQDVFQAADGLRVSTPARAVFDCASRLDEFALRSMIESGFRQNFLDPKSLEDVGERLCQRGRRGTRLFRRVTNLARDAEPVHSEDELLLLDSLRRNGITDATPQHPIQVSSGFTIHLDVGIPSSRTGVEVDGPTHDDPIALHRDRSRDLHVAVQGWQVLRVTADDVRKHLGPVTAMILTITRQRATLLRGLESRRH